MPTTAGISASARETDIAKDDQGIALAHCRVEAYAAGPVRLRRLSGGEDARVSEPLLMGEAAGGDGCSALHRCGPVWTGPHCGARKTSPSLALPAWLIVTAAGERSWREW